MPEYAENGLRMRWAVPEDKSLANGSRRALVRLKSDEPVSGVRAVYTPVTGLCRMLRGLPMGVDSKTGEQLFALDLPAPPSEGAAWRPIATCAGREVDPARAGMSAERVDDAVPVPDPGHATIPPHVSPSHQARFAFEPRFLFRVTAPVYRDDSPIGETPDGLRMAFLLRGGGYVRGPALNGDIEHRGGDWMRIRTDGIGVCDIHAVIRTEKGEIVLTEYSGVVDFGSDGYRQIAAGGGPKRAPLRFAPRYLTSAPGLKWLNRLQCFSVGQVDLERFLVEYDLYTMAIPANERA